MKVVILGSGLSGNAVKNYFVKKGITPLVYEGDGREEIDLAADLIVKSPGIRLNHPWVLKAKKYTTELEIALKLLPPEKRVIGITGSNGKTTTTLLVAHILQGCACGNVGVPLLDKVDAPFDIFVVELSSFQLISLPKGPYFDAAFILNITTNHLDWHSSMEEYVKAKWHLFSCLKEEGVGGTFEKYGKGLNERVETISHLRYRKEKFLPHDWENIAAAHFLCKKMGVSDELFEERLATFQKPPHRMEFVCTIDGIDFVNDSKATSVDAMIKAVAALKGNIVLLVGGVDKGGNFAENLPKGKVRSVIAFGEAAKRIAQELGEDFFVEIVPSLREGVQRARLRAKKGDTVLLSPGCSSYDQFKNFEERGDQFKALVYEGK